uniref:Uncharacterized protein n=1 Tax=Trepomonas sp. PC1 TaxID=1076344 RepID=A0A146K285_9EUKA|eukprot:JAP89659.1 Hypothetical protein TPC1_30846 [Trepomonas sp. PC1]
MSSCKLHVMAQAKFLIDELTNKDNTEFEVYKYITDNFDELEGAKFWRQLKHRIPRGFHDEDHKQVYIDATSEYRTAIPDLHDVEIQFFTWNAAAQGITSASQLIDFLTSFFKQQNYWKVDIGYLVKKVLRRVANLKQPIEQKLAEQLENFIEFCADESQSKMMLFDKKGRMKGDFLELQREITKQEKPKIGRPKKATVEVAAKEKEVAKEKEQVKDVKQKYNKKTKENAEIQIQKVDTQTEKVQEVYVTPLDNKKIAENNELVTTLISFQQTYNTKISEQMDMLVRMMNDVVCSMGKMSDCFSQPLNKMSEGISQLVKQQQQLNQKKKTQ